ncbi:MAG: glutamate synthase-related protein [Desulfatiglans sp.]|jgi:ferredoxin|nr:glutamate synthase-related protein [Desulfatiglans sp.]
MPEKYVIHTHPVPNRFKPLARSGIIAWEEGCLRCAVCVKEKCVYDVYYKRGLDSRHMIDSIDNLCMNCLRCVQGCPKELIHKSVNPEFEAMGDALFTPDIIAGLWGQAETGKIPVSGAGYPGPFIGPGFDSMWTDMSEIVRPTRDGIHGREYISTAVDVGRTPDHLSFDEKGRLVRQTPLLLDLPLPIILRVPRFGAMSLKTIEGWAMAARSLGTLLAVPQSSLPDLSHDFAPWLMPILGSEPPDEGLIPTGIRIVEVPWTDRWEKAVTKIREMSPSTLISIRIPMMEGMEEKALALARASTDIMHLEGGEGTPYDWQRLKEGIRSVHLKLVEANVRDEVTLLAGGGFAMAEHVAKGMICGADAVFAEFQMLIALQCRMCRRCVEGLSCPVDIAGASSKWVAARLVNLIGAWHNQLLELMGAMGIRDARRLRGEVGRAMFFEDLDETTFGSMNMLKEGYELE